MGPWRAVPRRRDRVRPLRLRGRGVRFTDLDEPGVLLDEGLDECDPVVVDRVAPRANDLLRAFRRR